MPHVNAPATRPLIRRPAPPRWRRVARVAAAIAVGGLVLAACGSSSATKPTVASPATTIKHVAIVRCPLTDTPAPGNVVPQRPAIAMKVDNYSLGPAPAEARPQSGLDYADVIFEEQVEGSITRYAAVFQCRNAPGLVGPIRSARWTDVQMLSELDHPLLVHVGGIIPVLQTINASQLVNVDLGTHPALETNPPGRYAPYDTYTTTAAIWNAITAPKKAPAPIFNFSAKPPPGKAVSQVHLDWSVTSDIYWRWNPPTHTWLRFYNVGSTAVPNIQPDLLADGVQNQAQNVIIQDVTITYGPWVENSQGGLEAESHILDNHGTAYVLRNGEMITGTWTAGPAGTPTVFLTASGHPLTLAPGRTWVEIYPVGAPMVATPVVHATPAG